MTPCIQDQESMVLMHLLAIPRVNLVICRIAIAFLYENAAIASHLVVGMTLSSCAAIVLRHQYALGVHVAPA